MAIFSSYAAPSAMHADDTLLIYSGADLDTAQVTKPQIHSGAQDFGSLYEVTGSPGTTITVTTAGTYYGWVSATAGPLQGITADVADATGDNLVIAKTGNYLVSGLVCFSGSNNAIVQAAFFIDGTRSTTAEMYRKLSANGDIGMASISAILALTAAEEVSLRFTSDTNADSVNIWAANLNVTELL